MHTDPQGLPLSGASGAGAALFTTALDEMLRFKPALFDSLDAAIAESPGFALPYVSKAYFHLFMTEPGPVAEARALLAALRRNVKLDALSERERGHLAAAEAWAAGDLRRAADVLDEVNVAAPRDVLALRLGHELDFFIGNTRNLRDRVARALSAWSVDDPHYGFVLACYAFGLEENGHYERAEECARRAVELHPDDVWGVHAGAHTFEMRGRLADGVRFMREAQAGWSDGNLFAVHNWWHYAMYHLDAGAYDDVLEIYDRTLFNERSPRFALVLLDGTSMLWRLQLEGVDVGARWRALADAWSEILPAEPFYVFNDMHAAMAYVGAGRVAEADALVARIEKYLARGDRTATTYAMAERAGHPVCRAIAAFGRGRYAAAAELLFAVRMRANEFGGSHAQRDVLDRTLIEAATRAGRFDLARALASERQHLRPENPYGWSNAVRAARAAGDEAGARAAEQRTEALRAEFRRRVGR